MQDDCLLVPVPYRAGVRILADNLPDRSCRCSDVAPGAELKSEGPTHGRAAEYAHRRVVSLGLRAGRRQRAPVDQGVPLMTSSSDTDPAVWQLAGAMPDPSTSQPRCRSSDVCQDSARRDRNVPRTVSRFPGVPVTGGTLSAGLPRLRIEYGSLSGFSKMSRAAFGGQPVPFD
jgi:hypothetical protein